MPPVNQSVLQLPPNRWRLESQTLPTGGVLAAWSDQDYSYIVRKISIHGARPASQDNVSSEVQLVP
ncbi:hypothetical protein EMCG_09321 [[Emmonsia] crescens]|uniref:Uncharacterized protein n=1 Tax=[Emmonsia] crescens TaxID=73230 RepID=A0A0G2I3I7_9EURO|nr:hypothetical protein EMCG_09321 [Emmonsia crescens UAMH 3008]